MLKGFGSAIMKEVLLTIYVILFWITEANTLYYAFLYIIGLFSFKQKYPIVEDKQTFCIFVPCHNEKDVVAATVKNYANINYDKAKFDVFFIADNCNDETANVLKETIASLNLQNFYVLERNVDDPTKKGKPHAIRWGIEQLEICSSGFYERYNMFMIFDADNFIDADILKHINSQYLSYKPKKRPVMIQTYLDSKNKNGLVARGYFAMYRMTNAFWQISKQKLGLVPAIGGTGFAMSTAFLKEIGGFNCNSLTEDLEIQTKATIRNKRIAYNKNVRIYDEKPTRVKQSLVQRTRWAQGHWYLSFKYLPILFFQLFNLKTIKATFRKLDMIIYLSSRFFILCATLFVPLNVYVSIVGTTQYIPLWISYLNTCSVILSFLLIPLSSLKDGRSDEKKHIIRDFIPNMISIYLVSLIDIVAGFIGLFKCGNQKVWAKTAHKITEMPETEKNNVDVNKKVG